MYYHDGFLIFFLVFIAIKSFLFFLNAENFNKIIYINKYNYDNLFVILMHRLGIIDLNK